MSVCSRPEARPAEASRSGLAPNGLQHRAVVRPIDLDVDQARPVDRARRVDRARELVGSVVAVEAGHAETLARAPPSSTPPSATPAGGSRRACCLISIRLSDASLNTIVMIAQPLAHRRQQLAGAHQQPAVAGERDDRAARGRRSAAPIAAGSANPIVDRPFEISMPFGSRTGQQHRRGKHVRAGVDGHAARRRRAPGGDVHDALRASGRGAGMSTRFRCSPHGARDRVEIPLGRPHAPLRACASAVGMSVDPLRRERHVVVRHIASG